MRLRVHRGTREIGGSCIELESAGSRILLDLGLPLDSKDLESTPLPNVSGLSEPDASLLAIILSHGHRDHWGLVPKVRPEIPLLMGKATESIMRAAADFVPDGVALTAAE
jgi:ribonuclease J